MPGMGCGHDFEARNKYINELKKWGREYSSEKERKIYFIIFHIGLFIGCPLLFVGSLSVLSPRPFGILFCLGGLTLLCFLGGYLDTIYWKYVDNK